MAGLDGKGAAEGAKGSQQINRKSSEDIQGEPRGAAEGAKGSQGEPRGAGKSIARQTATWHAEERDDTAHGSH